MIRAALLIIASTGFCLAANENTSLGGKVGSQTEGAMEGVLIGAKKAGTAVGVWVVSNARGEYAFPRERLTPGKYTIRARAVGYELPQTSVEVAGEPTRLNLELLPVARKMKLAAQLSNAELLMSIPGSPQDKRALGNCVTCHTLQPVLFSRFDAEDMTRVVQRMNMHTNNSSPLQPWMRPASRASAPPAQPSAFAHYLSSINLSAADSFAFPLKVLPRPKGKATEVIYTMYELPRADAAPHDEVLDAQGNVWYSDFNSQYLGKLDPKTGKVVEYKVPQRRFGQIAQGGLQIDIDREGRIYYGNMSQLQIVRFDPKTEKMETFKPPVREEEMGDAHLTMIDPAFQHVDGKIWANIVFDAGEAGGTWQIDLATNQWTKVTYPAKSPSARAYDIVADSKNNMYGMHMNNGKLWMTDAANLKTVWFDFPTADGGCRRGHIDAQDRLWCGGFNRNTVAMLDPKTQKITEWKVPTEWSRPYDAQFDDKVYVWAAGMDNDFAVRLHPQSGEFTEYLLPHETNVRNVAVQKSGSLSSLWLGDQHGATIVHVEPLAP
jgi:streptogramin lyase